MRSSKNPTEKTNDDLLRVGTKLNALNKRLEVVLRGRRFRMKLKLRKQGETCLNCRRTGTAYRRIYVQLTLSNFVG